MAERAVRTSVITFRRAPCAPRPRARRRSRARCAWRARAVRRRPRRRRRRSRRPRAPGSSSASMVSGSASLVTTTVRRGGLVIAVEIAPAHRVGGDLDDVGATRERDPVGPQVVDPPPPAGQAEVEPEHVGRLEHGDAGALARRPAPPRPSPGRSPPSTTTSRPASGVRIDQPRTELVDRAHVREVDAGERGPAPARAARHDDHVGAGRDHRVGVEPGHRAAPRRPRSSSWCSNHRSRSALMSEVAAA